MEETRYVVNRRTEIDVAYQKQPVQRYIDLFKTEWEQQNIVRIGIELKTRFEEPEFIVVQETRTINIESIKIS